MKNYLSYLFSFQDIFQNLELILTRHGFVDVNVTDNGRNLTSIFYDNIDTKDKDHFSIFKKGDQVQLDWAY